MPKCAVSICGITTHRAKKKVTLHSFPKEPTLRKKSMNFCGVKNDGKDLFICSKHFQQQDFKNIYRDDARRKLVRTAVPSIRVPPPDELSDRAIRLERSVQKELVKELLLKDQEDCSNPREVPSNVREISDRVSQFFKASENSSVCDVPKSVEHSVNFSDAPTGHDNVTGLDEMNTSGFKTLWQAICDSKAISDPYQPATATQGNVHQDVVECMDSMDDVKMITFSDKQDKRRITDLNSTIADLQRTVRELTLKLRDKDAQIQLMEKVYRKKETGKEKQIEDLKQAVDCLRKSTKDIITLSEDQIKQRVRSVLLQIFTENQTDLILEEKKKVVWTAKEIAMAFSLRYHSQPAYEIVRTDLKIPLPCLRSLREWASCINMRKGILTEVFTVLNIVGKQMKPRDRVVVLGFDEMSVDGTVEYDKRNDDIIGPHKEVQVIVARGLFSKWKQPVYVDFDCNMSKSTLDDIITRFHEIGFTVVANVHDCGGGNLKVWKEVGINHSEGTTAMKHPATNRNIYFFPDVPHLLKLIRNWLLDHGFLYKGKLITKQFLERLVEKASTLYKPFCKDDRESTNIELNSMFKLTLKHITVSGAERQNVRMAAELLSHTTAVNLRRHFGQYEEAQLLAEVIDIVDAWFDVMNSHMINHSVATKRCFGLDLDFQNQILDAMAALMTGMRTLSKHCLPAANHLQIFQKAILVSITSLKNLFMDMRADYGISFIMLYKLNQDYIENLFSLLRLNGGTHDHPSPLQTLDRLRLIILGKTLNHQVKRNQNTQCSVLDEDYIMAKLFRKPKAIVEDAAGKTDCIYKADVSSDDDDELSQKNERSIEEVDGKQYVFGYMARSLRKEYPELGNRTHEIEILPRLD